MIYISEWNTISPPRLYYMNRLIQDNRSANVSKSWKQRDHLKNRQENTNAFDKNPADEKYSADYNIKCWALVFRELIYNS